MTATRTVPEIYDRIRSRSARSSQRPSRGAGIVTGSLTRRRLVRVQAAPRKFSRSEPMVELPRRMPAIPTRLS